jgi:hypothetical protein
MGPCNGTNRLRVLKYRHALAYMMFVPERCTLELLHDGVDEQCAGPLSVIICTACRGCARVVTAEGDLLMSRRFQECLYGVNWHVNLPDTAEDATWCAVKLASWSSFAVRISTAYVHILGGSMSFGDPFLLFLLECAAERALQRARQCVCPEALHSATPEAFSS